MMFSECSSSLGTQVSKHASSLGLSEFSDADCQFTWIFPP